MVITKKDKMKNIETNSIFLGHQLLPLFPSLTLFLILMTLKRKKISKSVIVLNGGGS